MTTILVEKKTIQGIPTLAFAPADARSRPIVFYIHGFGGRKEEDVAVGYRMAEAGLFCVLVDAYAHGERFGPPVSELDNPNRATVYPPGTGFDIFIAMFDCILHTTRDLDTLLEHFSADPRVDTTRVGVSGFSMGGYAAFTAAAHNPRISAAVPMGSYPVLEQRWRDLVLEASSYEEWSAEMAQLHDETERRAAWFHEFDPYLKMKDSFDKPLLILIGDRDTDAPKFYILPLYAALRPRYQACPERLKLKIYNGLDHRLTGEMIQDAADWFRKFLLDEAA